MILIAFLLLAAGGLLFAECVRQSLRGMQGLPIKSPLVYNMRGILQLTSFFLNIVAIVILFRERWWLGFIGIVVAFVGTRFYAFAFIKMDTELKAKLLNQDEEH